MILGLRKGKTKYYMQDSTPNLLEKQVSSEVFEFLYHAIGDAEGNDDDLAQELTSKLMKRLKPVLSQATQDLIGKLKVIEESNTVVVGDKFDEGFDLGLKTALKRVISLLKEGQD